MLPLSKGGNVSSGSSVGSGAGTVFGGAAFFFCSSLYWRSVVIARTPGVASLFFTHAEKRIASTPTTATTRALRRDIDHLSFGGIDGFRLVPARRDAELRAVRVTERQPRHSGDHPHHERLR